MPDPRFFLDRGPVALQTVIELTGARLADPDQTARVLVGIAPLNVAGPDDLSFFSDARYAADLTTSRAGACFVPEALAGRLPAGCAALAVAEPQVAYAKVAAWLYAPRRISADDPLVHPSVMLEDDVRLAPGVVIGEGTRIGRGSSIGANAVIGPGVSIGRQCSIGANVSLSFALLGDNVRLLAGVVIGEAGFGMAGGAGGILDIPQLGRVIIQDNVTIGANSCVDRGAFGDTVIGDSCKIDNLVQIGHNVRLGRGCLVVSQVGISGSVVAGDGVRFGGQAGIADHLTIGDGATLMARTGLTRDVPAREVWGGYPAFPSRQWLRQVNWLAKAAGTKKRREGDTEA